MCVEEAEEMFRVARPSQLVLRFPYLLKQIPPGITLKLEESCSQILNACLPFCTTTSVPVIEYSNLTNKKKSQYQSPFRIHFNVDHFELVYIAQYILPELKFSSKDKLNELLEFLKEKDCEWADVKKEWSILDLSRAEVQQRYLLLEEFSFFKPSLPQVLYIEAYLRTKVESLRVQGVYSDEFDVIGNLLRKIRPLKLPEAVISKIKSDFQDVEKYTLADIHVHILVHYLSHRFMVDVKLVKDSFKINNLPTWKALRDYNQICNIIMKILNMDFYDVMDHPLLLDLEPSNTLQMVKLCPLIRKTHIVELVKIYPAILMIPYKNVLKWAHLLEKYKARKFLLTPDIIKLLKGENFRMVEDRLMILHKMPEYEIIMMSRSFITLLYKPNVIKKLVEMLHSGRTLTSVSSLFSEYSSTREALPVSIIPREMKLFIADKLGFDEKDPDFELLDEVRTDLGLNNTRMVLEILLDYGFTREQVMGAVQILSYPYSAIKATVKELPIIPEIQPYADWKQTPQMMDFIAYFVEKRIDSW